MVCMVCVIEHYVVCSCICFLWFDQVMEPLRQRVRVCEKLRSRVNGEVLISVLVFEVCVKL